jgi:hypothetical protein
MGKQVQPFPENDLLVKNLNLTCSQLARRVGKTGGTAYSYVVRTVKIDRQNLAFKQEGSAPNFQGGYLTLCTCKHQMRSRLECAEWPGKWIVGFTSRSHYEGRHWLFCLTQVAEAHESHAELWESLPAAVRKAKSAQQNYLGDLFAPRGKVAGDGRFEPRRYFTPPHHVHHENSCHTGWHNGIKYRHAKRNGRTPATSSERRGENVSTGDRPHLDLQHEAAELTIPGSTAKVQPCFAVRRRSNAHSPASTSTSPTTSTQLDEDR